MHSGARGREAGRSVGAQSKPFTLNRSEEVSLFGYKPSCSLACEQAVRGTLAAGREKEGELATTSLELNSTSSSPVAPHGLSCQISANQREAETSANVNKR